MKRQTGFYWVKEDGLWIIAYYFADILGWLTVGYTANVSDSFFDEINEDRVINPKEQLINAVESLKNAHNGK